MDRRTNLQTGKHDKKKKNIGSCLDLNIQYSTVWKADDATPQITDPLNVRLVFEYIYGTRSLPHVGGTVRANCTRARAMGSPWSWEAGTP